MTQRKPKTNAERARAYRARRRAGRHILPLSVPHDFVNACLWAGLITDEDVKDKTAMSEKLGDIIDAMVTHWDEKQQSIGRLKAVTRYGFLETLVI